MVASCGFCNRHHGPDQKCDTTNEYNVFCSQCRMNVFRESRRHAEWAVKLHWLNTDHVATIYRRDTDATGWPLQRP